MGMSVGIVPIKIRLIKRTRGTFLALEVPSPNGLGFFKIGGFLLGFAPFPVDVGTQTYLEAEVGTEPALGPD